MHTPQSAADWPANSASQPASDVMNAKITSLLQGIISLGATALKRPSEQDAEYRELIRLATPQLIALLSHRKMYTRKAGADALLQLSEQAEFRGAILAAFPQIIALLSHSKSDVRINGADILSKLSKHGDFREVIRPAIPQIIDFLAHPESSVVEGGADVLATLSAEAEFQESIGTAIPQIISLLSHSNFYVRITGAKALLKLSEQGEFRELIRPAIPEIIPFLSDSEVIVLQEGAVVLSKLSAEAAFRESIQPAIPHIIALLSHTNSRVRMSAENALSKLSIQAEFRGSILASFPQIIAVLSHIRPDIRVTGANALSNLSEQVEFRESISTAIPQIIALLSHWIRDIRMAGVNTLLKLLDQAEFRESISTAIPQIIALLSDTERCIRGAGANALLKFSEKLEFQGSIYAAIPEIIALLSHQEAEVRMMGASVLLKLSEQPGFLEPIRPAFPQLIAVCRSSEAFIRTAGEGSSSKLSEKAQFREPVHSPNPEVIARFSKADEDTPKAGAHALRKFSKQTEVREPVAAAIPQHTPDIADSDKSEHFQTTTCWIAAEHALQHARSNRSSVSQVFDRWKIQKSDYLIHAGFDESLIKSGIGYLEQIHIFVSTEVDATSLLLSELGRLFSPFSSILFTDSSLYYLPVFKTDGNVWDFDELVYSTASKFADGGSSAKIPLTVISLSQTPRMAAGPTGFSQGGSGSEEGEKKENRRSEKGEERGSGDKDETHKRDKDDEDPDDDPEDPSGDQGGIIAGPAEISFEIGSRIYPIQDEQDTFQTLTVHGDLTIETTPLLQSPPQFSKRRVQFAELKFDSEPTTDIAYKQYQVKVVVDSKQQNARVKDIHPKTTLESDRQQKHLSSKKTGRNRSMGAGLTFGPHPQLSITGTAMKTIKETAGVEKIRYNSSITEHYRDGSVRWGFDVDDVNFQKWGMHIREDSLPTARFEFVGDSDVPAPPPKSIDIVIASYWSMILPSERKSTWIRKLLRFFKISDNSQTMSYSNLFQIVALTTVPSNLPATSHYKAGVDVRSGTSGPPEVKRQSADSVSVIPAVVGDLEKLGPFNLPQIAKFKFSENCIVILENPCGDSKSH